MPTLEQNFVNQQLRPLAEKVRALDVEIAAMSISWFAGVSTAIANDSTPYDDGRPNEGLTQMTGIDVNNAVANLLGIMAGTAAYSATVISKPTVQPLQAN